MGKGKRVAFYLRVSTGSQTVENQRQELAKAAEQRGWTVVELYSDNGVSGAKGRYKRPAFDRMCKDAIAGKLDVIAAWSVDRLGRSVLHLAQFVEDMRAAGVGLFLLKQGLDSETPTGPAMLGMCSVFAELEREIIRERIHSGLGRARAQGKTLGRKTVSARTEDRIRELRAKGLGKLKIAREVGCGVSTVQLDARSFDQLVNRVDRLLSRAHGLLDRRQRRPLLVEIQPTTRTELWPSPSAISETTQVPQ